MDRNKWGYRPKPKLTNPKHRCECGQTATVTHRNRRICQRCKDAELVLYNHSDPLIPRVNAAAQSLQITLVHVVKVGARGRAHLPFDLEAA
jgi:hypothetical protein